VILQSQNVIPKQKIYPLRKTVFIAYEEFFGMIDAPVKRYERTLLASAAKRKTFTYINTSTFVFLFCFILQVNFFSHKQGTHFINDKVREETTSI